ncbi:hypothetical protein EMIHUDRAFT_258086, partial [Emiliania huxleyi CCMP1516]|uniref:Inosine/uridine-preferring nucleoside hydrolase domain-containing protein n=2 Tax=Emiliania huxleyi TaxID=2903 RepID=A0A0D3ICD4_EMIH1
MPERIIIDTDMSIDVDDVGALCLAHALQDRNKAEILAVTHNTGLEQGVGAVSVINHYFGRDDIPIGAYRGPVPDALTVLRQALFNAPGHRTVTIVAIGHALNVLALLKSPGGLDLVKRKLTSDALSRWPVEVPTVFVSFDIGFWVRVGGVLKTGAPVNSPCRQAFVDFCGVVDDWAIRVRLGIPRWRQEVEQAERLEEHDH